jgi:hypothetical protein
VLSGEQVDNEFLALLVTSNSYKGTNTDAKGGARRRLERRGEGERITSFTRTKVRILTQKAGLDGVLSGEDVEEDNEEDNEEDAEGADKQEEEEDEWVETHEILGSVCGLKLLVYAALSYSCMRRRRSGSRRTRF